MKRGQMITIAVSGVMAIAAGMIAKNMTKTQVQRDVVRETVDATQVLVAKQDIPLGKVLHRDDFRWVNWPREAVNGQYIQERTRQNAMTELTGYIARSPLIANEPITLGKVVKTEGGGVLSAILPPGYRAISTRIKEETGVGKLILPNDHVDVILTQRKRGPRGQEEFVSDTMFRNVRVLAIGQLIENKSGGSKNANSEGGGGNNNNNGKENSKHSAEGSTATLELTPRQAELLALANSMGEIALSLRSVADINSVDGDGSALAKNQPSGVRITRYGNKTRAYGVQ